MADEDRLRLEYDRAVAIFRDLTDVRFKLLALVPTLSGAAVGLLKGEQAGHARQIGVAIVAVFGLLALQQVLRIDRRD